MTNNHIKNYNINNNNNNNNNNNIKSNDNLWGLAKDPHRSSIGLSYRTNND